MIYYHPSDPKNTTMYTAIFPFSSTKSKILLLKEDENAEFSVTVKKNSGLRIAHYSNPSFMIDSKIID